MEHQNQSVNKFMSLNLFIFKEKKLVFKKIKNYTYDLNQDIFLKAPESKQLKFSLKFLKKSLSQRRKKNKKNKRLPFLRVNFKKLLRKVKKTNTIQKVLNSFYEALSNPRILFKQITKRRHLAALVKRCIRLQTFKIIDFNFLLRNFKKQTIIDKLTRKPIIKIIKKPREKKTNNLLPTPIKVKKQKLFFFFYLSILGKKIVSYFIKKGKKQQAEKIVYQILTELLILVKTNNKLKKKNLTLTSSLLILKRALICLMPFYELRSFRMKGQTNTTLLPLYNKRRRLFLIFKLLQNFLKNQKKPYAKRFAETLFASSQKEGPFYSLFLKNLKEQRKEYPKVHFRWVR